jgi:hypothetical protein
MRASFRGLWQHNSQIPHMNSSWRKPSLRENELNQKQPTISLDFVGLGDKKLQVVCNRLPRLLNGFEIGRLQGLPSRPHLFFIVASGVPDFQALQRLIPAG